MGGSALALTNIRRYNADEFFSLSATITKQLQEAFLGVCIEPVQAYRNKPDFGDLDILVENLDGTKPAMDRYLADIGIKEVVKNGSVWSLAWGNNIEMPDFQVDLLFQKSIHFDFARRFFDWNDCGNLLGRVARRLGFKLGFDGLWYVLYDGTYKFAELCLTRNFDEALLFLGYDPEHHINGFESLNDIFEFIVSSKYFDPKWFDLAERSYEARKRDNKRPNYLLFLKWINQRSFNRNTIHKTESLDRAFEMFSGFKQAYNNAQDKHQVAKKIKAKFNGNLISEWTGLKGKELGHFIGYLKSTSDNFEEFILQSDESTIQQWVKDTPLVVK